MPDKARILRLMMLDGPQPAIAIRTGGPLALLEATKSVRMAKVVRRSIHLTPFGDDFCRICLAIDATSWRSCRSTRTPRR